MGIRLTVGRKQGLGFALAGAFLAVLSVVSFRSVGSLLDDQDSVTHTYEVMDQLAAIESSLKVGETGQRGFLITGDDDYLAPFTAGVESASSALDSVAELTADNPDQQERIAELHVLVDQKFAEMQETIDLRNGEGFAAAREVVLTNAGKAVMDEIRTVWTRCTRPRTRC